MNRRLFLNTTMGFASFPIWSPFKKKEPYSKELLLGMSKLPLFSDTIPLTLEVGEAFMEMQNAALKQGIFLEIVSGYRSYERQKSIWNRKYKSNELVGLSPQKNIKKIIEYSTLPGTSRHHWGTDVDIIDGSQIREGDVLVEEKFHDQGPYVKLKKWMDQHAEKFGFYLPYTQNPKRKGFYYEPWHYSYAPLAIPMLNSYLKLDLNKELLTSGLEGSNYLNAQFLAKYKTENILGIAKILKKF